MKLIRVETQQQTQVD